MNKVILIGNLTRDPDARQTPSGVPVTTFSIAVNRPVSNQQGEREADFFNIVTWRKLAETCAKYLAKGRKVGVVGRLQTRSYDDNTGQKRWVTEIIADEVEFLTARSEDGRGNYPSSPGEDYAPSEPKGKTYGAPDAGSKGKSYAPAAHEMDDDFTSINEDDEIPF
jgi:single-strand DNA-binding protein